MSVAWARWLTLRTAAHVAYSLDGSDDRITLPEHYSPGTGDCTVSGWFYTTQTNSNNKWVYSNYATGTSAVVVRTLNGKIQALYRDENNLTVSAESTTTIAANTWYHVAAVREGDTVRVYVDGVLEASTTDALLDDVDVSDGAAPVIGTYATLPNYATYLWVGRLDDICVFDAAKSATDISLIASNGRGWLDDTYRPDALSTSSQTSSAGSTAVGQSVQATIGQCSQSGFAGSVTQALQVAGTIGTASLAGGTGNPKFGFDLAGSIGTATISSGVGNVDLGFDVRATGLARQCFATSGSWERSAWCFDQWIDRHCCR